MLVTALTGCAAERPTPLASEEIQDPSTEPGDGAFEAEDAGQGPESAQGETSASSLPALDSIPPPQDNVSAVITGAGILVPVLGLDLGGYVVKTPCGEEATVSGGQPVENVRVLIDPGHGGDERGAETGDLDEADINMEIASRLVPLLNEAEIPAFLTRTGDYRVPVSGRTFLADHMGVEALVSIHHNTPAVDPSPEPGTEMYVQSGSDDSRRLGGLLYEEVFETLSGYDVEWVSRSTAGVLHVVNDEGSDAYGINRRPATVSVLAEIAYLGNPKEAAIMTSDQYLDSVAEALAKGIERYFNTEDPGSGFVDQPRVFNPSAATGGTSGCIDPDLE